MIKSQYRMTYEVHTPAVLNVIKMSLFKKKITRLLLRINRTHQHSSVQLKQLQLLFKMLELFELMKQYIAILVPSYIYMCINL